jgi:hypothetical protein
VSLRHPRVLPTGLLIGSLVAGMVGFAARTPADSNTIDVEDVKPGMKGYGLTVLSGSTPERFDVEVVGILQNFRPAQELIIIRTDHPRLDVARTVAGMSGSPIYIEGKLAGAYAYGWFFSREPIAGVTPIEHMLADLRRPVPPELLPGPKRPPLPGKQAANAAPNTESLGHRYRGAPLDYDLRKHATELAQRTAPVLAPPQGMDLRPASTDLMVGGLAPGALKLLTDLVQPAGMTVLQAGGGGRPKPPPAVAGDPTAKYVDGGVITVDLVRGDVSISGLGTVTHVVGDRLVAFGHPMLMGGIENLPTAVGTVHWILASEQRSFKIGESVRPLGSLVNDRQAAIVVDTTFDAPVFPCSLEIDGAIGHQKKTWNMEVSHDPMLAPTFVAVGIGSALEVVASERIDMTWRAQSKVHVAGYGVLDLVDFGAGNNMPLGPSDIARSRVVRAMGALMNNPWKVGEVERVEMKMQITYDRDVKTLRGAQVLEPEIDAGQPLRVKLTLDPYLGQQETQVIEIPIDPSLAGQEVRIRLSPGYMTDRVLAPPESFEELLAVLPRLEFPDESIVATYELPQESAAAFRGHVASRLPPGMADTLSSTTTSAAPLVFGAVRQVVVPTKGFITGQDFVRVKVRNVLR